MCIRDRLYSPSLGQISRVRRDDSVDITFRDRSSDESRKKVDTAHVRLVRPLNEGERVTAQDKSRNWRDARIVKV